MATPLAYVFLLLYKTTLHGVLTIHSQVDHDLSLRPPLMYKTIIWKVKFDHHIFEVFKKSVKVKFNFLLQRFAVAKEDDRLINKIECNKNMISAAQFLSTTVEQFLPMAAWAMLMVLLWIKLHVGSTSKINSQYCKTTNKMSKIHKSYAILIA